MKPINVAEIEQISHELKALEGGMLQAVHQPEENKVILRFRAAGQNLLLLISCADDLSRLHLLESKPPSPQTPLYFCTLLRSRITPARLLEIRNTPGDRVVSLLFSTKDEEGTVRQYKLIAELTGRNANVFLVDQNGVLEGSMRSNRSNKRENVPGQAYTELSAPQFLRQSDTSRFLEQVDSDEEFAVNHEAAQYFEDAELTWRAELARNEVLRELKKRLKKVERGFAAIAKEEERALRAEEFRRYGDLLQISFHLLKNGMEKIEVDDVFNDGVKVEIKLEAALTPRKNVDAYYKRAKKGQRSIGPLAKRRAELEEAKDLWERLRELAESDDEGLEKVREKLGLNNKERSKSKRQEAPRQPFRLFVSASGKQIYVGRSAADNDKISVQIARGDDFWMHASGQAGSHVLIPLRKGEQLDQESLIDAASLAVHYSKATRSGAGEVIYTRAKYVKKLRKAPVGQVTVSQFKSIFVKVEEDRIKRLMRDSNRISNQE